MDGAYCVLNDVLTRRYNDDYDDVLDRKTFS